MFAFGRGDWTGSLAAQTQGAVDARLQGVCTGLVAGTKVATPGGWRAAEAIAEGDKVLTFDGGMQSVRSVRRQIVWTGATGEGVAHWPLHVPAHALGNREGMVLLTRQAVMVESDVAESLLGDPFAMIPALSLEGYRGISRMPPDARIEVVQLGFDQDEVVFANVGALFLCPAQTDLLTAPEPAYSVLSLDVADALVSQMELEDRRIMGGLERVEARVA